MKVDWKKLIIGIIAAFLLMILPESVFASDVILGDPNAKYIYVLDIRVGDKNEAGTDGEMTGYFYFSDSTHKVRLEIPNYDDLERESVTTYKVGINKHPLLLGNVQVKNESEDAVYIEWIAFMVYGNNGKTTELKQVFYRFDQWFESNNSSRSNSAYLNVSGVTRRKLTSLSDFDSKFGQTVYLEEDENSGTVDAAWSGKITDQYGTYNYYEKVSNNPNFSMSLSGIGSNGTLHNKLDDFIPPITRTSNTYSGQTYYRGFTADKKALYEKMKVKGINKLVITPKLEFWGSYAGTFSKNVTIIRKNFSIGQLTVLNDYDSFYAMQDNSFFNKSNEQIVLRLEILNGANHNNYNANDIASNLSGDFRLYYNRKGDYVESVKIESWNNYADLTFPVPADSDNDDSGLRLVMKGVTSKTGGIDGFKLVDGDKPYTETVERYLSSYKVDTMSPEFPISDTITGVWSNTKTFGVSTGETIYLNAGQRDLEENKPYEGFFYYTLYDSGSFALQGEKAPKINIKSFDNDNGDPKSHAAPCSESTEITLKLMNKEEGRYTLVLSGYDFAGNRGIQTYSDVLLDNKAPNVSVGVIKHPREIDDTRTAEYKFYITDLSESGVVNYCFVKEGESIPDFENPSKTSGIIESMIGKWAYVQQSDATTTTAVLKLEREGSFKGRLYYFATDDSQNSTVADNKSKDTPEYNVDPDTGYYYRDINFYNEDAECTLIVEPYSYPQKNYNISFDYDLNKNNVQYRWVEILPYYHDYSMEPNVGSSSQWGSNQQYITLNGKYTLEYKVTNTDSGSTAVYTEEFIFDNEKPVATIFDVDSGFISNAHTFKLNAYDISGLKEASYAIVNAADTSDIYDSRSIGINNGTVSRTVSIDNVDSGAYKLIFKAIDNNDYEEVVESNTFHIRSSAPNVEVDVDFEHSIGDSYITSDSDYHVGLKVSEPMVAANLFANDQYVKYRVSGDGINYSDWITGNKLVIDDKGLSAEMDISNPIVLNEGQNNVTIQVANAAFSDNLDRVSPNMITTLAPIRIYYDVHGPEYSISLVDSLTSAPFITGTLYLRDKGTGNEGMMLIPDHSSISVSELVEEEDEGFYKYTIQVNDNVVTTITARDKVGNETIIPVKVNCFDREGPLVENLSLNYINKGERKDVSGEIDVKGAVFDKTRFALIKKSEYTGEILEGDFSYNITHFSVVALSESIELTQYGEINARYSYSIRGLTGAYMIGVYAVDHLGNETLEIVCDEITVHDAEARLVDTRIVSTNVMYNATVILNFNVPVYVLPKELHATETTEGMELGEINEELALSKADFYTSTQPYLVSSPGTHKIYAADDCGRTYTFEITVDSVTFGDGIPVTWELFKDIEGTEPLDVVHAVYDSYLHVSIDTDVYKNAVLIPLIQEESGTGGMGSEEWYIDENPDFDYLEGVTVTDAVYGQPGFKTLVYRGNSTDRVVKNIYFLVREYEVPQEGDDDVRWKDTYERLSIVCFDSTPPQLDVTLSTSAFTNENVMISLNASDSESGIDFFGYYIGEYFDWEGMDRYELKPVLTQVVKEPGKSSTAVFTTLQVEESTHIIVYVENGVGMYTVASFPVNNILKAPITYGEDYTVSYFYQDYTGQWKEMTEDVYYRNAKAVIHFTTSDQSENDRGLHIINNAGSNERILTVTNTTFEFELSDKYGNKGKHTVSANRFEMEGPEISYYIENTSKTNQPVGIQITVRDEKSGVAPELVSLESNSGISIFLTRESGPDGSFIYHAEIPHSGTYTVTAYDGIGNISVKSFDISNIDTTPPAITGLSYSTQAMTNQSVTVQITGFTKPGVTITGTEPVPPLTTRDYQVSIFSRMINFSKNGTITVFFIDEYGNEGSDIISVGNIYSAPPSLVAVSNITQDRLRVDVTFEQEKKEDGSPVDPVRTLKDIYVSYSGIVYLANEASFTFTDNGSYTFKVFDNAGMIQYITLDIEDIDKIAPKITQVTWSYHYYRNENNEWVLKTETGSVTPGGEAGYTVADDLYPATNQDVKVKVTTDKETSYIGGADDEVPALDHEIEYRNNGLFNFNLEAANGLSTSYGVDIEVIDKTPPVIVLENPVELMFVENGSLYSKELLNDYKAYDTFNGVTRDLSSNVIVDWGGFDPDNLSNNTFDRSRPYYITYKVYDRVGNYTELRRKITLVGFDDTIALINGIMPDATSSVLLKGNRFDISLYNFSGTAYVKYEYGQYTMGQMKSKGKMIAEDNGLYSLENLSRGWYTVYIQTDRRDYFVVYVYVSGSAEGSVKRVMKTTS